MTTSPSEKEKVAQALTPRYTAALLKGDMRDFRSCLLEMAKVDPGIQEDIQHGEETYGKGWYVAIFHAVRAERLDMPFPLLKHSRDVTTKMLRRYLLEVPDAPGINRDYKKYKNATCGCCAFFQKDCSQPPSRPRRLATDLHCPQYQFRFGVLVGEKKSLIIKP